MCAITELYTTRMEDAKVNSGITFNGAEQRMLVQNMIGQMKVVIGGRRHRNSTTNNV